MKLSLILFSAAIGNAAAAAPTVDQDGFELAMRFGTNSQFTFCSAYWTDRILLDNGDPTATKDADGKFASYVNTIATKIKGCLPGGCKVYDLPTPMTLLELFTNTPIGSNENVKFSMKGESDEALEWTQIVGQSLPFPEKRRGWYASGINYYDDMSSCPSKVRFGGLFNNEGSIATVNDAIGFGAIECGGGRVGAGASLFQLQDRPSTGTIWVLPAADQTPRDMPAPPPAAAPSSVCGAGFTSAPTIAPSASPSTDPQPIAPTVSTELQEAGESDTDVNQGDQSSTSLAEQLRRKWLMDTPRIQYVKPDNQIILEFLESTDKLSPGKFQAQFYDFKCRDDGTEAYKQQTTPGASDDNGTDGFGPNDKLNSATDGDEVDWSSSPGVFAETWSNIPNTEGNLKGRPYTGSWNNGVYVGWDPLGTLADDGLHDFPPCQEEGQAAPSTCPGFPKFSFKLKPAVVADLPRIYEKVGSHPGTTCDSTTCQSRLDKDKTYPLADKGKGIMRFCVRTNLGYLTDNISTPGGAASAVGAGGLFREVNFLETLVTIKYTLEAGFTIDAFAVEPKEREEVTAIKDSYELEAYLCNPEDRHLQEIGKLPAAPGISKDDICEPANQNGQTGLINNVLCDPGNLRNVPKAITKFNTGSTTEAGEEDFVNGVVDTANPTATPSQNTDSFNQGALITVCVRPDSATFNDGIRLASLQTFDWYRDVPAVKQQAIVGGEEASNMLTAYNSVGPGAVFSNHITGFIPFPIPWSNWNTSPQSYGPLFTHGQCKDAAEWCSFSSILFADFYKNAGEVFGVGTAFLEFARRRLGDANKPDGDATRKLQETGGSSPFNLVVRTNLADNGPGTLKTAGGASYSVTLVPTAMALLSAALLA